LSSSTGGTCVMRDIPVYLIGCPDPIRSDLTGMVCGVGGTVSGAFPTASAALDRLRPSMTLPPVLVVYVGDTAALNEIRTLRRVAPSSPVLALTGQSEFIGAMRAGATQVAMTPLEHADFEAALRAIAEQYEPAAKTGRVVSVTGASGGCGATTLAVNLAVELAGLGSSVVLAEPTLTVGKLALFLDAHPALTTADLFHGGGELDRKTIESALHPVSDRLRLLAADYRSVPSAAFPVDAGIRLVTSVRGAADYVVLDLPCTYDDAFFGTLAAADTVVLVGDQRLPSVRTLQMLTEVLGRTEGAREIRVVINKYDPDVPGFTAENLKVMLQVPTVDTVASDGKAVVAAVNAARPLETAAPRSAVRGDILRLAQHLSGATPTGRGFGDGKPALLGRLARAFGLGRG
jgi:pilus assembly protein CpaE